jgi:hypothetical protein
MVVFIEGRGRSAPTSGTTRLRMLFLLLAAIPALANAQGDLHGRVLADSGVPVVGADVAIPALHLTTTTDSAGRFHFRGLKSGDHLMRFRALGFRADSSVVEIEDAQVAVRDFVLKRQVVTLPETRVTAPEVAYKGKMAGFMERQKVGVGHFIDRKMLDDGQGRSRTGDLLTRIPGVVVVGSGPRAFIATGRSVTSGSCAFCRPAALSQADRQSGAQANKCYMDVYLDGILIWDEGQRQQGLFDINSLDLGAIEGIEVYTSAAQIPAQYNRTSHGCGVLLIWTRIG